MNPANPQAKMIADGRVFVGTTTYAGKTALRPAIVNWRTDIPDVELIVDVTLALTRAERKSADLK